MTFAHWNTMITLIVALVTCVIVAYTWQRLPILAVATVGWFAVSLTASQRGFFQNATAWSESDLTGFLLFGMLMTLPMLAFFITWIYSPALQILMNSIPLPALIGIGVYRVAGVIFLWLFAQEMMPAIVGLFTGFADLLIGATALPLAWSLARRMPGARQLAIAWNVFGISDFVIVVSIVSLSILGLMRLQPDPVIIGLYPLALIALFQLPLSIIIHVVALRRLISQERILAWL